MCENCGWTIFYRKWQWKTSWLPKKKNAQKHQEKFSIAIKIPGEVCIYLLPRQRNSSSCKAKSWRKIAVFGREEKIVEEKWQKLGSGTKPSIGNNKRARFVSYKRLGTAVPLKERIATRFARTELRAHVANWEISSDQPNSFECYTTDGGRRHFINIKCLLILHSTV